MGKKIKIVELFAGVGGFRIGLEKASNDKTDYKRWRLNAVVNLYIHP